jgi:hypothetical protein
MCHLLCKIMFTMCTMCNKWHNHNQKPAKKDGQRLLKCNCCWRRSSSWVQLRGHSKTNAIFLILSSIMLELISLINKANVTYDVDIEVLEEPF